MSIEVTFEDHLSAIELAAEQLAEDAASAGRAAKVPTCPLWNVGDLVDHVGTVHRWATANLGGKRSSELAALIAEGEGTKPADPTARAEWFREGAAVLVKTLRAAPEDLKATRFLANAPAPRAFWARRQAHETTMHRVDALAARLGHLPTVAQLDLPVAFALDGLDELLTGFLPRASSALRTDDPFLITVAPSDADRAWTVRISADAPMIVTEADPKANTVLTGTAAGLYLSLWNRVDEIAETGHEDVLGLWRDKVRIRWR